MAEKQSKRTWVIEEGVVRTPDGDLVLGQEFDMERAELLLSRLLGTLAEIGGIFTVVADRVRVGEGPAGAVLATTPRLIVEWQAFSPLRAASNEGAEPEPLPWDPEPDEFEARLDEQAEEQMREAAAAEAPDDHPVPVGGDPWDTDAEPIEEPDA